MIRAINAFDTSIFIRAPSLPWQAGGDLLAGQMYISGAYRDGAAEEARFFSPYGLAVDEGGGLYIADSLNHSIRYLKDEHVTTAVGSAGEYGSANGYWPSDIALDQDGNRYIADTLNNKIRKVSLLRE